MTRVGPDSFTLHFTRPGAAVVRIRASTLWEARKHDVCVGETASGWLMVNAGSTGSVTVTTTPDFDDVGQKLDRCRIAH